MRFWCSLALCVVLHHVIPPDSPDPLTIRWFVLLLCRVSFLLRLVGLCVWFARARVYTRPYGLHTQIFNFPYVECTFSQTLQITKHTKHSYT